MTCTFYTSHSHNIENLRKQGRRLDARLVYVWPDDTKEARRRFSLLKEAYVKARYSKHYRIGGDDLEWLGERVRDLSSIVQEVCAEHLAALAKAVTDDRASPDAPQP